MTTLATDIRSNLFAKLNAAVGVRDAEEYADKVELLGRAHEELRSLSEDAQTFSTEESVATASTSTDVMVELLKGIMKLETMLVDFETDVGM